MAWDDPAAAGLRAAMQAEMEARYADRVADVLARAAAPESRLHSTLGVEAEQVAYVGVAYAGDAAVGHVALRWLDGDLELKRMYVAPGHRGSGAARVLLAAAEGAARSLGASRIILQTGDRQPEAVRLYEREGYAHIPVFPPYEWLDFSVCMEKVL
ncbi:GNAT family N-acetyltransferase [Actinomadura fibrosa]|uniref:GNAT family N-acetyltransferase n=1 Tax=Actinomadura fibrosa TaxID=111802 RepID=A0ABW2Y3N3_9ACTN|nr:GNAT family N-acetyltransferase [Actinomadura fibrosa]